MNNKIFTLILVAIFQLSAAPLWAQTVLNPGDVSITGFNAGNGDIAFVSWVPLAPETKICFTNNGWNSTATTTTAGNARNMEEIATWSNSTGSTIAAGTIIVTKTASPYTANLGTTTVFSNSSTSTTPALAIQGGDQITIYQTASGNGYSDNNNASATFNGTAIGILQWPFDFISSGNIDHITSYLPSDLSGYATRFLYTFENPYQHYVGTRTGKTVEEFKQLVRSSGNWTNHWSNPLNTTAFDVPVTLPVSLLSFSAAYKANTIELVWSTSAEVNTAKFEVETSSNGTSFTKVTEVAAKGGGTARAEYRFAHATTEGVHFYRLKMVDNNGSYTYSNVARVSVTKADRSVSVHPNPVVNNKINIQLGNFLPGTYSVILTGSNGQVAFQAKITSNGGNHNTSLQLPSLTKGIYNMQVKNDAQAYNTRVLIN
ncbi:T9SS type A sorting domain-containing protein [Aridibaculum aurantiacum]|uniref:T9SS type A sorting domain-containing protein n=1 Tax=Aridibaculum aurantiacum TaxID=2810307 RepID=UPI001A96A35F|nr:T9SS type A sorting domain-containing protein [Aridibaculum aurantiacum]